MFEPIPTHTTQLANKCERLTIARATYEPRRTGPCLLLPRLDLPPPLALSHRNSGQSRLAEFWLPPKCQPRCSAERSQRLDGLSTDPHETTATRHARIDHPNGLTTGQLSGMNTRP